MLHRGPDDAGCVRTEGAWLASRRLAIIDIGDSGHQPFRDEETGVTIVFNGEIFNYIELRRELESRRHRFVSRSDTEVLLRSYLEWGSACVRHLNGMWAFIIWDPRQRGAFFSRDRFGVKPLFMARVRGGLALASEPKVLLALYPQLRSADEEAVARLLGERSLYDDGRSFYKAISVFPAAHWGAFKPADVEVTLERFWAYPDARRSDALSWQDAQAGFGALFEDSVRVRLRSDVPLGVTLSGGLDSTAVLHATRRGLGAEPEIRAYTSTYAEYDAQGRRVDERDWAKLALTRSGRSTLREIPAPDGDLLEVLRRIVWHMDGPGISPAVFPLWRIMQVARGDGVKVLLEGQGADELLGGYASHLAAAILDGCARAIRERSARSAAEVVRSARAISGAFPVRRVLGDVIAELAPPARAWDQRRSTALEALRPGLLTVSTSAAGVDGDEGDHLRSSLLRDFTHALLPGFLHYGDAISMAHSVESRLPFLDHRLVEFCFRLPSEHKLRRGMSKALLRAYLARAGHDQIANNRRKRGYPTPVNQWLARDGGAVLREVLLDRSARTRAYVVPKALERLIDRHAAGAFAAGDVLFGLLSTEVWLRECVGSG